MGARRTRTDANRWSPFKVSPFQGRSERWSSNATTEQVAGGGGARGAHVDRLAALEAKPRGAARRALWIDEGSAGRGGFQFAQSERVGSGGE